MPEQGKLEWSVCDVNYKLIHRGNGQFEKGHHEIVLNKKDVPNKGVLILELKYKEESAQLKMVRVD